MLAGGAPSPRRGARFAGHLLVAVVYGGLAGWLLSSAGWIWLEPVMLLPVYLYYRRTSPSRAALRERAYRCRGGMAGLRADLDLSLIRQVRDTQGELAAVKALRREAPHVPLEAAVQLVRGLDAVERDGDGPMSRSAEERSSSPGRWTRMPARGPHGPEAESAGQDEGASACGINRHLKSRRNS